MSRVLLLLTALGQAPAPGPLVLERVTVIDVDRGVAVPDRTVVVAGDSIVSVGPAGAPLPPGARRIDGAGRFLAPGLVDGHAHLFDRNDLGLDLRFGITTVLNMSGAPITLDWARAVREGALVGPMIYTTGPQLKVDANPAVDFERAVRAPADAEPLIALQARAGYEFVKVWGAFSPEVYRAIMAAAHRHRLRVTGHIPMAVGLDGVLRAGQSSIAHLEEYFNKVFDRRVDDAGIPAAVARTREAGIPVITTLVTYEAIAGSVAADSSVLLARPERRLLDPVRRMLWEPDLNRYRTPPNRGRDDFFREALAFEQRLALALERAGVPLIAGTDAGELPGLVPGADLHRELALLAQAGLSNAEVLRSATLNPGRYLGGSTPFGTIAPGSRADLLLLSRNPLDDLRALRHPDAVIVRGRYLPAASLDSIGADLAARNERTGRVLAATLRGGPPAAVAAADSARPATFPLLLLAHVSGLRGKTEVALGLLDLAARLEPESYLPVYMKAGALLAAGDTAGAVAGFERTLTLRPGHDGALWHLSRLRP